MSDQINKLVNLWTKFDLDAAMRQSLHECEENLNRMKKQLITYMQYEKMKN